MDGEKPRQVNNSPDLSSRNVVLGTVVEHEVCRFKQASWGGCSIGHCSGTGACDILRKMGLRNIQGDH